MLELEASLADASGLGGGLRATSPRCVSERRVRHRGRSPELGTSGVTVLGTVVVGAAFCVPATEGWAVAPADFKAEV